MMTTAADGTPTGAPPAGAAKKTLAGRSLAELMENNRGSVFDLADLAAQDDGNLDDWLYTPPTAAGAGAPDSTSLSAAADAAGLARLSLWTDGGSTALDNPDGDLSDSGGAASKQPDDAVLHWLQQEDADAGAAEPDGSAYFHPIPPPPMTPTTPTTAVSASSSNGSVPSSKHNSIRLSHLLGADGFGESLTDMTLDLRPLSLTDMKVDLEQLEKSKTRAKNRRGIMFLDQEPPLEGLAEMSPLTTPADEEPNPLANATATSAPIAASAPDSHLSAAQSAALAAASAASAAASIAARPAGSPAPGSVSAVTATAREANKSELALMNSLLENARAAAKVRADREREASAGMPASSANASVAASDEGSGTATPTPTNGLAYLHHPPSPASLPASHVPLPASGPGSRRTSISSEVSAGSRASSSLPKPSRSASRSRLPASSSTSSLGLPRSASRARSRSPSAPGIPSTRRAPRTEDGDLEPMPISRVPTPHAAAAPPPARPFSIMSEDSLTGAGGDGPMPAQYVPESTPPPVPIQYQHHTYSTTGHNYPGSPANGGPPRIPLPATPTGLPRPKTPTSALPRPKTPTSGLQRPKTPTATGSYDSLLTASPSSSSLSVSSASGSGRRSASRSRTPIPGAGSGITPPSGLRAPSPRPGLTSAGATAGQSRLVPPGSAAASRGRSPSTGSTASGSLSIGGGGSHLRGLSPSGIPRPGTAASNASGSGLPRPKTPSSSMGMSGSGIRRVASPRPKY
ncbi:hypothetical protein H9P43_001075 [Blastocladiella emersonii ATCC 22665]|nr:hypothetical protein H9P43_001075 [Blastocladiella emersonii ATCC 22665]